MCFIVFGHMTESGGQICFRDDHDNRSFSFAIVFVFLCLNANEMLILLNDLLYLRHRKARDLDSVTAFVLRV